MKSFPHAKIVEVDGHQILYWVEPDEDRENGLILHQQVSVELGMVDLQTKVIAKAAEEYDGKDFLNRVDETHSRTFLEAVEEIVKGHQQ